MKASSTIFFFLAIVLVQVISTFYLSGLIYELNEVPEYGTNGVEAHNVWGVYFKAPTFCAQITGRNEEAINETIYHEVCHHLVETEPTHFCK